VIRMPAGSPATVLAIEHLLQEKPLRGCHKKL
jgi:hypothetical protein